VRTTVPENIGWKVSGGFGQNPSIGTQGHAHGHLVTIISVDKLIVVNAVRGIPLHPPDSWLAGVERNNVVDEGLAVGRELD